MHRQPGIIGVAVHHPGFRAELIGNHRRHLRLLPREKLQQLRIVLPDLRLLIAVRLLQIQGGGFRVHCVLYRRLHLLRNGGVPVLRRHHDVAAAVDIVGNVGISRRGISRSPGRQQLLLHQRRQLLRIKDNVIGHGHAAAGPHIQRKQQRILPRQRFRMILLPEVNVFGLDCRVRAVDVRHRKAVVGHAVGIHKALHLAPADE